MLLSVSLSPTTTTAIKYHYRLVELHHPHNNQEYQEKRHLDLDYRRQDQLGNRPEKQLSTVVVAAAATG